MGLVRGKRGVGFRCLAVLRVRDYGRLRRLRQGRASSSLHPAREAEVHHLQGHRPGVAQGTRHNPSLSSGELPSNDIFLYYLFIYLFIHIFIIYLFTVPIYLCICLSS